MRKSARIARSGADNFLSCDLAAISENPFGVGLEPVIRGRSMKNTMHLLARIGLLALPVILSIGAASAQTDQTDIGKTIQAKLAAEVAKLESSCADDITKYCSDVTPGEGRMLYCMQAHEDKISAKCAFDLEEAATDVQLSADNLKEAITACRAEITGVCGKTQPGQGRIAACLIANKSTASTGCVDAIQKIEAMAAR
jgi:hypothetical protein